MSETDRLGEAIAISKARYGRAKKETPWGAMFIAAGLVFASILAIGIMLSLSMN